MRGLRFEHRREPVIPVQRFALRMGWVLLLWLALTLFGLAVGVVGYVLIEGANVEDAFLGAAAILSGMGLAGELKTIGGKFFAGAYTLFSGLFLVVATSFVLAPVLHRVLHSLHVEEGDKDDD
jgi:hypothetical protein